MKISTTIQIFLAVTMFSLAQAAPDAAALSHKLAVTPEIKQAFQAGFELPGWRHLPHSRRVPPANP